MSRAIVVATGVTANGDREVLGVAVGDSEDGAFWTGVPARPAGPGPGRGAPGDLRPPRGAQAGDRERCWSARPGSAAGCTSCATSWPRCPKASAEMVAAAIRTDLRPARRRACPLPARPIAGMLAGQFPDVATMLADAAEDLLAFTAFPQAHWRKIWSTNPLERLNGEIKRRTNVVGIFPNDAAVLRVWSPPSWSRPTTSGQSPSAATSPKSRWRSSTRPTTGGAVGNRALCEMMLSSGFTLPTFYTTPRT